MMSSHIPDTVVTVEDLDAPRISGEKEATKETRENLYRGGRSRGW